MTTSTNNTSIEVIITTDPIIEAHVTSGARGKSAYEIWLETNPGGTEAEFWDWIRNNYVHAQTIPSDSWTIHHNLEKYPSVTIVDSADTVVIGDIQYLDLNTLVVSFTSEFSGKAYLN